MTKNTIAVCEEEIKYLRQKISELGQKNSEDNFQILFEHASDSIFIADMDGWYLNANENACRLLGYSKEELKNYRFTDLMPREDLEKVPVNMSLFKDGRTIVRERRMIRKDGSLLIIEISAKMLPDNRLLAIVRDITERKQKESETELQNQLKFLRTLIETVPNPIYIKSADRKYIDCNKALTDLYGFTKEEAIGSSVYDITPYEYAVKVDKTDRKVIMELGTDETEIEITDRSNKKKTVLIHKTVFLKNDGTAGGIVGVITDITEQKRLHEKIEKALKREKELNELKSRFISMASHEFRTPLTSIKLYSDLLFNYRNEIDEHKFFIYKDKINSTISHMTELIDDVLTISRTETGNIPFRPSETDLHNLCAEIVEEMKISYPDCNVKIEYNCCSRFFNIDKKIINPIFSNLISNAIKYSSTGSYVRLEVRNDDQTIHFKVIDSGIGIPENDQKRLFEYFHRGENTGSIPGTGLGLAIVKKFVAIHKGTIKCQSELNKGTVFTVTIPVK